jgi:hypothetical protein
VIRCSFGDGHDILEKHGISIFGVYYNNGDSTLLHNCGGYIESQLRIPKNLHLSICRARDVLFIR